MTALAEPLTGLGAGAVMVLAGLWARSQRNSPNGYWRFGRNHPVRGRADRAVQFFGRDLFWILAMLFGAWLVVANLAILGYRMVT
jgi:hypothetical protein